MEYWLEFSCFFPVADPNNMSSALFTRVAPVLPS